MHPFAELHRRYGSHFDFSPFPHQNRRLYLRDRAVFEIVVVAPKRTGGVFTLTNQFHTNALRLRTSLSHFPLSSQIPLEARKSRMREHFEISKRRVPSQDAYRCNFNRYRSTRGSTIRASPKSDCNRRFRAKMEMAIAEVQPIKSRKPLRTYETDGVKNGGTEAHRTKTRNPTNSRTVTVTRNTLSRSEPRISRRGLPGIRKLVGRSWRRYWSSEILAWTRPADGRGLRLRFAFGSLRRCFVTESFLGRISRTNRIP